MKSYVVLFLFSFCLCIVGCEAKQATDSSSIKESQVIASVNDIVSSKTDSLGKCIENLKEKIGSIKLKLILPILILISCNFYFAV